MAPSQDQRSPRSRLALSPPHTIPLARPAGVRPKDRLLPLPPPCAATTLAVSRRPSPTSYTRPLTPRSQSHTPHLARPVFARLATSATHPAFAPWKSTNERPHQSSTAPKDLFDICLWHSQKSQSMQDNADATLRRTPS